LIGLLEHFTFPNSVAHSFGTLQKSCHEQTKCNVSLATVHSLYQKYTIVQAHIAAVNEHIIKHLATIQEASVLANISAVTAKQVKQITLHTDAHRNAVEIYKFLHK